MDTVDQAILSILQSDGRISNAELSERINLSPSACLRRVKNLEEEGIIEGYAMVVNQSAIGRSSNIFVEISLNSQSEEALNAFEAAVVNCPDIMECYLMAGDSDYVLRVAAGGPEDYERIHKSALSRLPGVARIRSNFTLRTVCKKTTYELL
ncbi:MAG: Lrp/AsnC family transcriptional regulator [Rhodospirillales bacterium]|nr:Lrp/AsnC family transcriptional regulator [Rhodospirillales bacterium]